jgi:hypothetical protein
MALAVTLAGSVTPVDNIRRIASLLALGDDMRTAVLPLCAQASYATTHHALGA